MKRKKTALRAIPKVLELTVSLRGTRPLVWRKILTHEFIELGELHVLIQITMGWENRHLHSFEINKKSYSDREAELEMTGMIDGEELQLCDVLGESKKFEYIYDFGDNWHHDVEITKVLEVDPRMRYPACVGGENACPPEDCGSAHRFQHFKEVLAGKDCQEKDELLSWVGGYYDPTTFDPNIINRLFFWNDDDF